jgi:hypothetical protein
MQEIQKKESKDWQKSNKNDPLKIQLDGKSLIVRWHTKNRNVIDTGKVTRVPSYFEITVFWDVMLCSLTELLFHPEDGGSTFLQYVGNSLPNYILSRPRRQ